MNTRSLAAALRGTLVTPESADYDRRRALHNGMIDRRPAAIACCLDAADVKTCVDFARADGVPLAVRCGGHDAGGLGSVDHGLTVDLSPMRCIRVDPKYQTVRVQSGCRWGDVDRATHPMGLTVPAGMISTAGVGGLTLGGGLGHLTRAYGLTIDNLVEANVVLADGSMVVASEHEHPDLFWALRGGGGNFGVVTSFLFKGRRAGTILGGPTFWHLDRIEEILGWYRDFILSAPRQLSGFFVVMTVPPAPPFPEHLHLARMCGVVWCHVGDPARGEKLLAEARSLDPDLDAVRVMPMPVLNSMFDGLHPKGRQLYWRADFFSEISDPSIALHAEWAGRLPTTLSSVHLYPIDGAAHDVAPGGTAWSYRDANWVCMIAGVAPDRSAAGAIREWATGYWEALHPHSSGGAYVNFMMEEGQERVRASYREHYPRLARIKADYDPDNLFRVNQNVHPAR